MNYNDAVHTIRLAKQICEYAYFHKIVIVDNASTDGSWEALRELSGEKVELIQAEKNGGYGFGNNLGVSYSVEQTGATHVVIANPDTMFSEACIKKMGRIFQRRAEVAVVGAVLEEEDAEGSENAWPLRGFFRELLSMDPICRRLFGRALHYPPEYFKGKAAVQVDVVHGSMLMVDAGVFLTCGGYDEAMFLYQEEAVLGWKMKQAGYRTILMQKDTYRHDHGVSIDKAYAGLEQRQRLRHDSTMHYFKEYWNIGRILEMAAKVWFSVIMTEIWVWKHLTGKKK